MEDTGNPAGSILKGLTMEPTVRQLTRSRQDRVFAGVCGGVASYLGIDSVLVRVLYVALTLLSWGIGIVLYTLAWVVIPLEMRSGTAPGRSARREPLHKNTRRVAGIFLVVVGMLALLSTTLGWLRALTDFRLAGPILLLAIGIGLLLWRKPAEIRRRTGTTLSEGYEWSEYESTGNVSRSAPPRLMRSASGRKIAGVCAGLGDYLHVDATIPRLLFIAAVFAGGAGVILYGIMWLIVPLRENATQPQPGA